MKNLENYYKIELFNETNYLSKFTDIYIINSSIQKIFIRKLNVEKIILPKYNNNNNNNSIPCILKIISKQEGFYSLFNYRYINIIYYSFEY